MGGFSDSFAGHGSWEYDLDTGAVAWTEALHRIYGVGPEFAPVEEVVREMVHPDDADEYRRIIDAAIERRSPFTVRHRIIRPDGVERTLIVRGAHIAAPAGGRGKLIGTTEDVTGRASDEERLWHLANHDSLTGLFNRRRFLEELVREMAVARRGGGGGAVLMLDLDRFKEINDSLGHMVGDGVIVEIAAALRARLRSTDTLARLGGDEFAIVLPGCQTVEALRVASQLARAVRERSAVTVAGRERRTTVSVGIAPFGERDGETADAILVAADLAMYRAKRVGGTAGAIEVYDDEMRAELAARLETEGELRTAIEEGELRVVYQTITSIDGGSAIGCEALARWEHPRRGTVSPAEFIPLAEEQGLIGPIGEFVLAEACRTATGWRENGHNVYVSVNVSPLQLTRHDVVDLVCDVLETTRLPGPLLCLEVTETALLDDATEMLPALRGLKALGVRLAIDDFGGGSSSFALLQELPLDQIKVDRAFVDRLPERPEDRAIVAAVLSLADELDLSVVAEGVETDLQHWELRELGCRYAQGFLYSRPVPATELDLAGYTGIAPPGVGDPSTIREFMRQIGIPARVRLG